MVLASTAFAISSRAPPPSRLPHSGIAELGRLSRILFSVSMTALLHVLAAPTTDICVERQPVPLTVLTDSDAVIAYWISSHVYPQCLSSRTCWPPGRV